MPLDKTNCMRAKERKDGPVEKTGDTDLTKFDDSKISKDEAPKKTSVIYSTMERQPDDDDELADLEAGDVPIPTTLQRAAVAPGAVSVLPTGRRPDSADDLESLSDEESVTQAAEGPILTAILVVEDDAEEPVLEAQTTKSTVIAIAEPMPTPPDPKSPLLTNRRKICIAVVIMLILAIAIAIGISLFLARDQIFTKDSSSSLAQPPLDDGKSADDSADEIVMTQSPSSNFTSGDASADGTYSPSMYENTPDEPSYPSLPGNDADDYTYSPSMSPGPTWSR